MKTPNIPEIKISVKIKKTAQDHDFVITRSTDVATFAKMCFNADEIAWREEVLILCLNRANKVIGFFKIGAGGFSGCVCDPKVVFSVALTCGASSIILAHNHPSGSTIPSQADISLTRTIKEGGHILDIHLLDHIIVTPTKDYYSFADEGML